jgi:hypothetical protein
VAQIAARRGPTDPVAAEHLAIDALASRRAPAEPAGKESFVALTSWGQSITVFHHCLAGESERAHTLLRWMRETGQPLDPALLAWISRECDKPNPD